MAKKKKPKKLSKPTPAASPSTSSKSKGQKGGGLPPLAKRIFQPRVLSTFAFGLSGLLAGLLTGLNHFPSFEETKVVPNMMLLAAYLGDPHVDMAAGMVTGVAGLIMGACLGFSALSAPKDLAASLLFSVVLSVFILTVTGNVAFASLGFLVGHAPAIMGYLKLRTA